MHEELKQAVLSALSELYNDSSISDLAIKDCLQEIAEEVQNLLDMLEYKE